MSLFAAGTVLHVWRHQQFRFTAFHRWVGPVGRHSASREDSVEESTGAIFGKEL